LGIRFGMIMIRKAAARFPKSTIKQGVEREDDSKKSHYPPTAIVAGGAAPDISVINDGDDA
jgi:hypothetical protein